MSGERQKRIDELVLEYVDRLNAGEASVQRGSENIAVLLNDTQTAGLDRLELICTELDFQSFSVPSERPGIRERSTKYIAPARDDPTLLPTLFQNVRRHPLHEEFLAAAFPERFAGLTQDEYNRVVGRRESRDYYVGGLRRVNDESGFLYLFSVVADTGFHPSEVLKLEEIQWVYERLRAALELEPLLYHPDTELARREIEENWPEPPPLPVYLGESRPDFDFEPYSLATGYGRVRLLTLTEFEEANRSGCFTLEDLPVVDQAPRDVEGVIGGLITAEPQGQLSHTAIRLARQGTPNAYVADALEGFAQYEGKLIRLEVCEGGYTVDDQVTLSEAEAFWAANRPEPPALPPFDEDYGELDRLSEMDLTATGGVPPEARFGGKAANLARLGRILGGDFERYRETGFAIPMRYYLEFLRSNFVTVGGRELSYEAYLGEILQAPEFGSGSCQRAAMLANFRDLVRSEGVVDPALVQRLAERIEEVFGSTTRMVRFRSSSNVEDGLEFNGAGLYESTSVCARDTLDPTTRDGSHCDPTRNNERTVERALKKVWSSLWTFRAFEARAHFQIAQERAVMGILVSRAFLDESANGVAFTGDPSAPGDRRYVITAQVGEESVVSPPPGVTAERNLLSVRGGEVVEIFRARSSSLVPPGETVLSDDHLRELGRFMATVDQNFPLELEGHARDDVLLDFEFKIEPPAGAHRTLPPLRE